MNDVKRHPLHRQGVLLAGQTGGEEIWLVDFEIHLSNKINKVY